MAEELQPGQAPIYQAATPLTETDEEGTEYVFLKGFKGAENAPTVRIPKSVAGSYLAQGYSLATNEDVQIKRYAEEHKGVVERTLALSHDYAPLTGLVDHAVNASLSDEENRIRREAAEIYSTPAEKFFMKAIPAVAELAGTTAVGKAAGIAAKSVKGAAAFGAAEGTVRAADLYLTDPKVSMETLAATVVVGSVASAISTKLVNMGSAAIGRRMQKAQGVMTPEKLAAHDQIAMRALTEAGLDLKTLRTIQEKGPGELAKYTREVSAKGLLQDNAEKAHAGYFANRSQAKQVFDKIERESIANGDVADPISLLKDAKAVRQSLINSMPGDAQAIRRVAANERANIMQAGEMNLSQLRQYKSQLRQRAGDAKKGTYKAASTEEKFYQSLWNKMDDVENNMVGQLDQITPGTSQLWQKAQRDWQVGTDFRKALASRMRREGKSHAVQMTENLNIGLASLFALSGNAAGVMFNGAWAGFRHWKNYANSPSVLAAKIEPGLQQGAANNVVRLVMDKVNASAVRLGGPVATRVGADMLKEEQEARAEREASIRANVDEYRDNLHEQLANPQEALKHAEALDGVGNLSPEHAMAGAMAVGRLSSAVEKHLPKKRIGMLLDTGWDTDIPISDMEREKQAEIIQAIVNPLDAMEKPSALQMQVLTDAYPEMVNSFKQRLLAELVEKHAQGVKFTLEDKDDISTYLQAGTSRENDPQFVARLQAFLKQVDSADQVPQPKRAPSASNFNSVSSNAETTSSRVGRL